VPEPTKAFSRGVIGSVVVVVAIAAGVGVVFEMRRFVRGARTGGAGGGGAARNGGGVTSSMKVEVRYRVEVQERLKAPTSASFQSEDQH
jgi:hypothetical protein